MPVTPPAPQSFPKRLLSLLLSLPTPPKPVAQDIDNLLEGRFQTVSLASSHPPLCTCSSNTTTETFLANLGVGIIKHRVSLFISSILAKHLPAHESTGLPYFLRTQLSKKMPSVHLVQMDLQKRFLAHNTSPVRVKLRAKNRGKAFPSPPLPPTHEKTRNK